ncbi:Uncharacterised protein [Mycobacterium tuberculosis]|nr:Uncharacterised protein [Mycobacterium tuberculosis]
MEFCVGMRVSLRKVMRPPSTPPLKVPSSSSAVLPPKPLSATALRVGSAAELTETIWEA